MQHSKHKTLRKMRSISRNATNTNSGEKIIGKARGATIAALSVVQDAQGNDEIERDTQQYYKYFCLPIRLFPTNTNPLLSFDMFLETK